MPTLLEIHPGDIVPSVSWNRHKSNLSAFDIKLLSAWKDAVKNGCFRYELNILRSSVIPGKWDFFAELNPERGENRRKPHEFFSVNDPFNPSLFNFTKIKNGEILFEVRIAESGQDSGNQNLLAINVSPMTEGHSLIIPFVEKMQPQVLTQSSIELGLYVLLMSATPSFRVAFNSLLGFASVNHLHLHCIYVDHCMSLESIVLEPLQGSCFQLTNYPGKGFAFQCSAQCENDIRSLARDVFKLTNFFQSRNEAHNVVMTRCKLSNNEEMSHIRVYVWVRTPSTGAKSATGFNPAALELFGYFVYKNTVAFESTNEAYICGVLEELTTEPFRRNYDLVKELFWAHGDSPALGEN
ncbi:hypothetical protein ONE63_007999 [Megalurothrips usitatus]|uniref:GDP-D-glucose phosphorylase 1 n=1 Tax=Megalurothrips usitatus TaxID=439358 RepID=A0AAV7XPG1_9NEOP|nr:hypothetical protein ONE63_007999 [Megalurothrips usitatus]